MYRVKDAGLIAIQARCQTELNRGRDLTPLMREISGILAYSEEQNFAAGGRPAWPDLASSTKRSRARRGKWPGQILQDSGQLAASIENGYSATAAWSGTNKEYAAAQQFGATIQQYARSQRIYLRANEKTGEVGHHFVTKKRSNFSQWVTIGNYTIKIPSRPFLKLTDEDQAKIMAAVVRFQNAP
jgi:phage virion morphogenesis protein